MVETLWWLVSSVKTYHSVADVLKKVEKTSSENNSFSIFEHPYRTCDSAGILELQRSACLELANTDARAKPLSVHHRFLDVNSNRKTAKNSNR